MTSLAGIVEDAGGDARGDGIQTGRIVHHDLRALAAAFKRDPLHVRLARVTEEHLANLVRAGKGDLVHIGMQPESRPSRRPKARHDVQHAIGKPRLGGQLSQEERGERRLLGGL